MCGCFKRMASMRIFWCPQFVANGHFMKRLWCCACNKIVRIIDIGWPICWCRFFCSCGLFIREGWMALTKYGAHGVVNNSSGRGTNAFCFARANNPQALLGAGKRDIQLAQLLLQTEFIGKIHRALIALWNNVARNPRHNTRGRLQGLLTMNGECWATSFQLVQASVVHHGVPFQTFGLMNVDDMNGVGARVLHTHGLERVHKFAHRARALRFKASCFLNKTRKAELIALIKERSAGLHEPSMPM